MATSNKLTYLNETKQKIKEAINESEIVKITDEPFRQYADKITTMQDKYKKYLSKVVVEKKGDDNILNLKDALNYNVLSMDIYGNSYQETTEGYNVLKFPYDGGTHYSANGITFDVNSDGSVKINGTSTNTVNYNLLANNENIENGNYTFKLLNGISGQIYIFCGSLDSGITGAGKIFNNVTVSNNTLGYFILQIPKDVTFNNLIVYPYLVKGTYTSDNIPDYEPYTGGQPSPSPEYPSEVKNVEGIENLYNYKDTSNVSNSGVTVDNDGWITVTCNNTGGSNTEFKNYFTNAMNLKPNTNYNIILEVKEIIGTLSETNCYLNVTDNNPSFQFDGDLQVFAKNLYNGYVQTFTIKTREDLTNILYGLRTFVAFGVGSNYSIKYRLSVIENISITSENFTYVPYGNKYLPINISGKNLIDYSMISTPTLQDNGYYLISFPGKKQILNGVFKENTQYTLSFNGYRYEGSASHRGGLFIFHYIDGTEDECAIKTSEPQEYVFASSIGKTIDYIQITYGTQHINYIKNLMLNEGSYASYEPYYEPKNYYYPFQDELCKINDVEDEIDIINGKLTKRIGKYVFTGDENISKSSYTRTQRYSISTSSIISNNNIISQSTSLCSHFKYDTKGIIGSYLSLTDYLYFDTDFESVDNFKQYLKEQYNNGTPVTIYYELAEPYTIEVEPIKISLNEGDNKVELTSDVKTTLDGEYIADGNELIKEEETDTSNATTLLPNSDNELRITDVEILPNKEVTKINKDLWQ